MAEPKRCSVDGCGRYFIPGKTGARGMCGMHERRTARGSPQANDPNPLRGRGRSVQLKSYVTPDLSVRIGLVAAALGMTVSEFVADRLPFVLDVEEKKIGLK